MSNIDVISQTQVITVTPTSQSITVNPLTGATLVVTAPGSAVSVTNAGPVGPRGAGAGYNHTQGSAQTVWTINHNLGYKPSVQAFTDGGLEMLGEIQHTTLNQTTITFNTAVTGTARLN